MEQASSVIPGAQTDTVVLGRAHHHDQQKVMNPRCVTGEILVLTPSHLCTAIVDVMGDAQADLDSMAKVLHERGCRPTDCSLERRQYIIQLDAAGRAVDVVPEGVSQTVVQCAREALSGLTFPCLGSLQICQPLCRAVLTSVGAAICPAV
ncbi:hypothetical protein ACFL5O_09150 [Myxococcota bacterium]